jgi:hypothetical protein
VPSAHPAPGSTAPPATDTTGYVAAGSCYWGAYTGFTFALLVAFTDSGWEQSYGLVNTGQTIPTAAFVEAQATVTGGGTYSLSDDGGVAASCVAAKAQALANG